MSIKRLKEQTLVTKMYKLNIIIVFHFLFVRGFQWSRNSFGQIISAQKEIATTPLPKSSAESVSITELLKSLFSNISQFVGQTWRTTFNGDKMKSSYNTGLYYIQLTVHAHTLAKRGSVLDTVKDYFNDIPVKELWDAYKTVDQRFLNILYFIVGREFPTPPVPPVPLDEETKAIRKQYWDVDGEGEDFLREKYYEVALDKTENTFKDTFDENVAAADTYL